MTEYSPILNIPEVAPNQNQKEATINTATAMLEAACNDTVTMTVSTGTFNVIADNFTRYFHHVYTGHVDATVVAVIPNTKRWFCAENGGAYPMALKIFGQTPTFTVPAGKRVLIVSDGTTMVAVSSGVGALADLSDVDGGQVPSNGQLLAYIAGSGRWEAVDNPYDLRFFTNSTTGNNAVFLREAIVRKATFYSNFIGSYAKAEVAATATTIFTVKKNGVTVGSFTFAAAATTATFSTDVGSGSTTVSVNATDVISIHGPATGDTTLAGLAVCIKGVYTQ